MQKKGNTKFRKEKNRRYQRHRRWYPKFVNPRHIALQWTKQYNSRHLEFNGPAAFPNGVSVLGVLHAVAVDLPGSGLTGPRTRYIQGEQQ